jgi:hypothetical protein
MAERSATADGLVSAICCNASAAKIAHITARPRVSLNLDSEGHGTGTVVVAGEARVDARWRRHAGGSRCSLPIFEQAPQPVGNTPGAVFGCGQGARHHG